RHGQDTLCPSDPQARFLAERWMDWQITAMLPLSALFRMLIRTPPEKRDADAVASAQAQSEAVFTLLNRHLDGRDFVETDDFTMGDIPIGAIAYRWLALGNRREDYPHLAAYHDRLAERPGFRAHVMLPLT